MEAINQENTIERRSEVSMLKRLVMWWRSLHIFHDWEKWQQYEETGTAYPGLLGGGIPKGGVSYSETRQRRFCKHCGKMQDEKVRES